MRVNLRRVHKITGIALILPFIAWSATAVFFLVRPAYREAYARLEVRQYPLAEIPSFQPAVDWRELRYFRSVLGPHLLVRREQGWAQLDPLTLLERPWPDDASLALLLSDAISVNPERYGSISALDGRRMRTDTGVDIEMDWDTLSFTQRGRDSRWIDRIYNIHYLRWTGIGPLDEVLGLTGLFLLMFMTWTGFRMLLRPARAASAGSRGQA